VRGEAGGWSEEIARSPSLPKQASPAATAPSSTLEGLITAGLLPP